MAIGPRDMENGTVEVARRDTMEKQVMQMTDIADKVEHLLQAIQDNLYQKALAMRERSTRAENPAVHDDSAQPTQSAPLQRFKPAQKRAIRETPLRMISSLVA
jgi:prolyl-tRNA synthetase